MKTPGPGKKKTFVMGKLIAKFRVAGMKPGGGRKRKRKPTPQQPRPKAKFTRRRRRYARPKP